MTARAPVTNTASTAAFHGDHAPAHLNMIALAGGFPVGDLSQPYTWCDYGCGDGYTANVMAAANPAGTFYGVDSAPDAIAHATALSEAAGLPNSRFLARRLAELMDDDLPPLDFAVMPGLLSWVDEQTRTALLDEAARRVKPGGMVLMAYNALPGWSARLPLRDMMYSLTPDGMDPVKRVQRGLEWMMRLKDADAPYFRDNPAVGAVLDQLTRLDPRAVARDYFNPDLRPFHFAQVNAELDRRGFTFAGSATGFLNMVDLSVPHALQDDFRAVTSRVELESKRDFLRNEAFRQDIWVKGKTYADTGAWQAAQDNMIYGTLLPASLIDQTVNFGDVELSYADSPFKEALAELTTRALRAGDLPAATNGTLPGGMGSEAARLLAAGGQVLPFVQVGAAEVPDDVSRDGPFAFALPFNRITCAQTALDQPMVALACPRAGTGITITNLEAQCLAALCAGEDGTPPTRDPDRAVTAALFDGLGPRDTLQVGRKKLTRVQVAEMVRARLAHLKTHLIPKLLTLDVIRPV